MAIGVVDLSDFTGRFLRKNVDKSVDMGIKDKSLINLKLERLFVSNVINIANSVGLLKTDSLFNCPFIEL